MRYYLYISDSKVDMLLSQIPGAVQQKVAASIGFNLQLLSGSISTERSTLDSRVAKLCTVEAHVRSTLPVGTPMQPSSWISGVLDAYTIDLGHGGVLFLASGANWVLGMGGSSYHLLGGVKTERIGKAQSFLPGIIEMLLFVSEERPALDRFFHHDLPYELIARDRHWMSILTCADHQSKAVPQRIEFLGKRLAVGTDHHTGKSLTLATPLYVALAD